MSSEFGTRSQKYGQRPTSGPEKPKKKKSLLKKILLGVLVIGLVGLVSGVGLFWYYAKNAPELDESRLSDTVSSKLYDINNEVFEDLGSEKREIIQPNDVPQSIKDAVVSVEDKRFYNHSGIDPIRIVGSLFSNIKRGGSGGLQGGSTLTQQLIKLSFFSTKASDQTLKRKAQEAWMAIKLEREHSKSEILTYYINKVYMANGVYGMQTAAETYYGKSLAELTLPQTALLAGMPQAPNDYDPYTNPDLAKQRRDIVLLTMRQNDKITQEEYDQAVASPVDDGLQPLNQSTSDRKMIDNYVTEVIAEVEEKTGKNVYTDGLDIYTNLDMDAQKMLFDIINTDEYVEYPDEDMQVASTVIDVKTGQVKAQIGRRNIPDDAQRTQNLAVNNARDVGSTMKPLVDYGPAIEFLDYSTGKLLVDRPTTYAGTTIPVFNSDLQYFGSMTMRKAIVYSRNTTAIQTFDAVGSEKAAQFLKGLGIEFQTLEAANAISSNTSELGDGKYGVSSLRLAAAYAAFGNGGVYNKPYYVSKVVYQDESVDEFTAESTQAMKESTAYMMTDMLKDVVTQGVNNAAIPGLIQAGKTGTSNYTDEDLQRMGMVGQTGIAPDSSFVGYTTHYAVSVWTGYEEKSTPIPLDYWGTASDIYREMMIYLSQNVANDDWIMPDSVVRIGSELYVKSAQAQQLPVYTYEPSTSSSTSESSSESSSSSSSTTESTSTVSESSSEPEPEPSSSSNAVEELPSSSEEPSVVIPAPTGPTP